MLGLHCNISFAYAGLHLHMALLPQLSALPAPRNADGRTAHTKIGSDGNAHDQQVVRLPAEGGQQQTFTAELHVDGQSMALGTVQVAELHKVGGLAGAGLEHSQW